MLIPRLSTKYGVNPVHTLDEIRKLKHKFPENITQFVIYYKGQIQAGITIFKTATVVKSQYGAVTEDGEVTRALDFLFISLINKYKTLGYQYFDMGRVTEDNFGLIKQKEELGCYLYPQDTYQIDLN